MQSIIGIVISILILTVGLFSLISYKGFSKPVSISAYNFVEHNSKASMVIDMESAKMLSEDNIENGEYASLIMVSSERTHRTAQTEMFSIIGVCLIICLIIAVILNLACDAMSLSSYYYKKLNTLSLILKCIILIFGIAIAVIIACYLSHLPADLGAVYKTGASCVILPILGALGIANWAIFKSLEKRSAVKVED